MADTLVSLQMTSLKEIAAERDRLYTERHTAMQAQISTALSGLTEALDKAFTSSQSALTNEHNLIMEMLASLKLATAANQTDIERLRNGASRLTGREEPIGAMVKWVAGLVALILAGLVAFFHK